MGPTQTQQEPWEGHQQTSSERQELLPLARISLDHLPGPLAKQKGTFQRSHFPNNGNRKMNKAKSKGLGETLQGKQRQKLSFKSTQGREFLKEAAAPPEQ